VPFIVINARSALGEQPEADQAENGADEGPGGCEGYSS
jgi:hypothetical protein